MAEADSPAAILKNLAERQVEWGDRSPEDQAIACAKALPREQQIDLILLAAGKLVRPATCSCGPGEYTYREEALLRRLLRRKLQLSEEQILALLASMAQWDGDGPLKGVLTLVGRHAITERIRDSLTALRSSPQLMSDYSDSREIRDRIDLLSGRTEPKTWFEPAGPWGRLVLEPLAAEPRAALEGLLNGGSRITASGPSKKWRAACEAAIAQIGRGEFRKIALEGLALGPDPEHRGEPLSPAEGDEQKGLLWALETFSDDEICLAIASFSERAMKKIPGLGPVGQKSANAAIRVLAAMSGQEAVGQLSRLAMRTKYAVSSRFIEEALEEAAERNGLSRDELAEITVSDCGLGPDGRRSEAVGDYVATLSSRDPTVRFRNAGAKVVKVLPATVRKEHAAVINKLRKQAKEVAEMVASQRLRIERLLMSERKIPYADWRKRYLDHPLLHDLTERLIWRFRWEGVENTAIPRGDGFVDWNGQPIEPPPEASVQLWHPLNSDPQTVLSWRCWTEDNAVVQPFKQAHREVYVLTAAERETRSYSNRFAAHILRQHQLAALARQRNWAYTLMGQWDSHNTPSLELPQFGLRVEFLVDPALDDALSHAMIYLYVTTDQVRFLEAGSYQPVDLEQIRPVLFSEVMREVDLFVGVSSAANDPNWTPGRHREVDQYWETWSFGELSASANSRRELLERLLPKLVIGAKCELEEKFLVVRGRRTTYRIHLGSGNVMMEPDNRYLCIVRGPTRGKGSDRVLLPFEGDMTLALILSKAFLLAEDHKIKDRTILDQLKDTPNLS